MNICRSTLITMIEIINYLIIVKRQRAMIYYLILFNDTLLFWFVQSICIWFKTRNLEMFQNASWFMKLNKASVYIVFRCDFVREQSMCNFTFLLKKISGCTNSYDSDFYTIWSEWWNNEHTTRNKLCIKNAFRKLKISFPCCFIVN